MRRIVTFLLFVFFFSSLNAQFSENNSIYLFTDAEVGNFFGGKIGLNYVLKEKYSFGVAYAAYGRKAKSTPVDYTSGLVGAVMFTMTEPNDELQNGLLMAGRIVKLNERGTIRLNLLTGFGYSELKNPSDWIKVDGDGFNIADNYLYDFEKKQIFSFIFNPKVEFPFTRFYGLSVSPLLLINKEITVVGIGIGQMIGVLRKRD